MTPPDGPRPMTFEDALKLARYAQRTQPDGRAAAAVGPRIISALLVELDGRGETIAEQAIAVHTMRGMLDGCEAEVAQLRAVVANLQGGA